MSRGLTNDMTTAVTGSELRPVLFFEGVFASGTVRYFSGYGTISWDGKTWTGGGKHVGVTPVSEVADVEARGISVLLNGFDSALVTTALSEARAGKSGKLWLGMLNDDGTIIADPQLIFAGRLDVPEITDSGESAAIAIDYENRLIDLERSRERRYTDEDQKIDYPSDRGFEFVEALVEKEVIWGRV